MPRKENPKEKQQPGISLPGRGEGAEPREDFPGEDNRKEKIRTDQKGKEKIKPAPGDDRSTGTGSENQKR